MTDTIIIKQAGPYTVTSDGDVFYVNGRQTDLITASGHLVGTLAGTLDTGCTGANGKRDVVGIAAEHVAAHRAFGLARGKSLQAVAPMSADEKARVAAERAFDAGYNDGGEGYNPYRAGSAPTYRRRTSR
jgi:hypothetical protein